MAGTAVTRMFRKGGREVLVIWRCYSSEHVPLPSVLIGVISPEWSFARKGLVRLTLSGCGMSLAFCALGYDKTDWYLWPVHVWRDQFVQTVVRVGRSPPDPS